MDVYEAVKSRRAVRGFTDRPVSMEVLERVGAIRIELAAVEHLRRDRRTAGRTQASSGRARGYG
jgi:hypothetical protein